eukprot:TRINITY_DN25326_c0_g1_i2.p1 TRINITY_DN25326_c0_g1~~TRINITY_DN25326_c0_g1_i2.p1  ORF type:complete len:446 (-),score=82.75 TRINITY_DN25326_c0_g1_i2:241-1410(-)
MAALGGAPRLLWQGFERRWHVLVVEAMGPSLKELLFFCGGSFSLKTVLILALQLLSLFEKLHVKGLTHRFVNPCNFFMGLGRTSGNIVHMANFTHQKQFCDESHQHIAFRENLGNRRFLDRNSTFASLGTHLGLEQSRRDDLEALGHLLVYLLRGHLPWEGLPEIEALEVKLAAAPEDVCAGLPKEFAEYLGYCRNLKFRAAPDYTYLRRLFTDVLEREELQMDAVFDWTLTSGKRTGLTYSRNKGWLEDEKWNAEAFSQQLPRLPKAMSMVQLPNLQAERGTKANHQTSDSRPKERHKSLPPLLDRGRQHHSTSSLHSSVQLRSPQKLPRIRSANADRHLPGSGVQTPDEHVEPAATTLQTSSWNAEGAGSFLQLLEGAASSMKALVT